MFSQQTLSMSILSEQDIRMFLQPAPVRRPVWRRLLWRVGGLTVLAVSVFFLLNIQAYIQLSQTPDTVRVIAQEASTSSEPATSTGTTNGQALAVAATPTPTPGPQIPNNTISIDSLGISAPVSWNIALTDAAIHDALEHSVAQIDGTALPGQKGIVVITGHSSNYIWDRGQYNTIFAPLHKAQEGEEIDLNYNGTTYVYRITKIYKVNPDQLAILQDESSTGLRLITCTPIGTALRRLVVDAVQVSPDPSTATAFTPKQFTGNLPSAK